MHPIQNASAFLIQSICDLYLFILLLRFFMQYLKVDYYNPLTQFVVKVTSPLITPLRRVIPGWWGIDLATVILILIFTMFKFILISLISIHAFPKIFGLLLWASGDVITSIIKLFFYAILMNIILSWVSPHAHSPITPISD